MATAALSRVLIVSFWAGLMTASAWQLPPQEGLDTAVSGTAVDDRSGIAIGGALVQLSIAEAGATALREVQTDENGRFEFPGVPDGEYTIDARTPNYLPLVAQVRAGTGVSHVLRLAGYGVLAGRLVPASSSGRVIAIEEVPAGVTPRTMSATPDRRGAFRIWGVPPGRYVLTVVNPTVDGRLMRGVVMHPAGGAPHEFVVTGGEAYEDIDLVLPAVASHTISGRVMASGADVPRVIASLRSASQPSLTPWTQLLPASLVFRVTDVLPGRYELSVRAARPADGRTSRWSAVVPVMVEAADVQMDVLLTRESEDNPDLVTDTPADARPGSVTGRVERRGTGVEPVAVVLMDMTPGRESPTRVIFVDASGEFSFGDLAPGRYYVTARPAASPAAWWWARDGARPAPTVEVRPGAATRGVLRW